MFLHGRLLRARHVSRSAPLAGFAVLPALLLALAPDVASSQGPDTSRTLTVTGQGEVHGEPDMATINVGVVTQAEGAEDAVKQNNRLIQKLITSLKERGIPQKDLQTAEFSVTPQYKHDPQGAQQPTITGYQVSNSLQVHVRKLDVLGSVLGELVEQGANQINQIRFSVQDPAPLLDEARRKAVADARRKAEVLAQAADEQLGVLLRLDEVNVGIPRPVYQAAARFAAAEAVPIETGQQTISAQVTLTYVLGN